MFSDILTPLPAMGIEFDVVRGTGPIIPSPLRSMADVRRPICSTRPTLTWSPSTPAPDRRWRRSLLSMIR